MAEDWKIKEVRWTIKDIGAPLLDSIARGLYSKLEVLREYVQNAVDSYVDFRRLTGVAPENTVQVWVDAENDALHIMDRGVGMNEKDIYDAKKIAVSPKLPRATEFAGFRGLGIWSGLSACEQLVLTTTKVDVPFAYRLTINCKSIVEHLEDNIPIDELLDGRFTIEECEWESDEHFTHVKLARIDKRLYGDLLNIETMMRYAEQSLPVPFNPDWPYAEKVLKILEDVENAQSYELTINGEPVYRSMPPVSEIKEPEGFLIEDDHRKRVAVAWVCETARAKTGAKKLSPKRKDTWVRNFAVRVKNLTIGSRGLYSERDVADAGNLDWFVGEIYITDPDIKPDTKRTQFQPSTRHDDVIRAVRKFYNSTALRARGLSEQIIVQTDCDQVGATAKDIERLLSRDDLDEQQVIQLKAKWELLTKLKSELVEAREEATKADKSEEAERVLIGRRYLRKVKENVDAALAHIDKLEPDVSQVMLNAIKTQRQEIDFDDPEQNRPSKALTATLQGTRISKSEVLGTQASFDDIVSGSKVPTSNENRYQTIDPNIVVEAVGATVAAVVGDETEIYRRIMARLPEELRRRGISV